MTVVLLASASPARLSVLRTAGLDPRVIVSGVDEEEVLGGLRHAEPEQQISSLAEAKADAVVRLVAAGAVPDLTAADGAAESTGDGTDDVVVIGCDSMLLIDGEMQGKPDGAEQAKQRWRQMAGRDAVLLTGHAVRRVRAGQVAAAVSATRSTTVRMGRPTEAELDAYIGTGEPLAVAGALTIDGFGGWFVEAVDGDPSNVIGISLPLTRELLRRVGVAVTDLWRVPTVAGPSGRQVTAPTAALATSNGSPISPVDSRSAATHLDSPTRRST